LSFDSGPIGPESKDRTGVLALVATTIRASTSVAVASTASSTARASSTRAASRLTSVPDTTSGSSSSNVATGQPYPES
jgi:hypothetical protein